MRDGPPTTDDVTLSTLEQQLTLLIRRALRGVWDAAAGDEATERHLYPLLVLLSRGPLRVGEVARRVGLDKSTVSRQLGRLVTAGLASTINDPADGRSAVVVLTPAGHERLARLRDERVATVRRLFATWPEGDRADLARLLTRLNHDLDALFTPRSLGGS
jgi:DNA-binding MarR family transcriptional regulator